MPGDKMLGAIFRRLGPIQSRPVDFVVSGDDKYEETNEQLIKGILKETSSVTLQLIKLVSFSKLEGFSGCFKLAATFTKSSLKRSTTTCSFVMKFSLTLIPKQLSADPFLLQAPNCLNIFHIVLGSFCPSASLF